MTHQVHQGQRYHCGQHEYLALESGNQAVKVARIDHDLMFPLHVPIVLHASQLTPLPVRRYFGEIR